MTFPAVLQFQKGKKVLFENIVSIFEVFGGKNVGRNFFGRKWFFLKN